MKTSRPAHVILFLCAFFALSFVRASSARAQNREQSDSGRLLPGESVSVRGVTIQWTEDEGQTSASAQDRTRTDRAGAGMTIRVTATPTPNPAPEAGDSRYPGRIVLRGPRTTLDITARDPDKTKRAFRVAMDGVYFVIEVNVSSRGSGAVPVGTDDRGRSRLPTQWSLQYGATAAPANYPLTAAPTRMQVYVSHDQPVMIGPFQASVSAAPVAYGGAAKYYQLTVKNGQTGQTGQTETLPLMDAYVRRIGRLILDVGEIDPITRTAILLVTADPDPTVRGRNAWVQEFEQDLQWTLAQAVSAFAERVGCEVQWDFGPLPADLVAEVKTRGADRYDFSNQTAQELLPRLLGRFASANPDVEWITKWADDTHVTIAVANSDEIVQGIEAQQERRAENKRREDLFDRDFKVVTRVYSLKSISAETGLKLVEPELRAHYLFPQSDKLTTVSLPLDNSDRDRIKPSAAREVVERALADSRTNGLIVWATDQTQQKVAQLIQAMEARLEREKPTAPPARTQLEAILLLGFKNSADVQEGKYEGARVLNEGEMRALGLAPADLRAQDLAGVAQAARGAIGLLNERGDAGRASLTLDETYRCEFIFQDVRPPYLILRARLTRGTDDQALIENTLYLEPGNPALLGLTNLRGAALILIVRQAPPQ